MTEYEKLSRFCNGDETVYFQMDADEKSMVHFMYLADRARKQFRETGDAKVIIGMIRLWLQLTDLSRQQSNAVLSIVAREISLKGSVV